MIFVLLVPGHSFGRETRRDPESNRIRILEEAFGILSIEVTRPKERAMMWIYVIEWLVVTGTLMVCGAPLWAVMVRRRLCREVAVTRATH